MFEIKIDKKPNNNKVPCDGCLLFPICQNNRGFKCKILEEFMDKEFSVKNNLFEFKEDISLHFILEIRKMFEPNRTINVKNNDSIIKTLSLYVEKNKNNGIIHMRYGSGYTVKCKKGFLGIYLLFKNLKTHQYVKYISHSLYFSTYFLGKGDSITFR